MTSWLGEAALISCQTCVDRRPAALGSLAVGDHRAAAPDCRADPAQLEARRQPACTAPGGSPRARRSRERRPLPVPPWRSPSAIRRDSWNRSRSRASDAWARRSDRRAPRCWPSASTSSADHLGIERLGRTALRRHVTVRARSASGGTLRGVDAPTPRRPTARSSRSSIRWRSRSGSRRLDAGNRRDLTSSDRRSASVCGTGRTSVTPCPGSAVGTPAPASAVRAATGASIADRPPALSATDRDAGRLPAGRSPTRRLPEVRPDGRRESSRRGGREDEPDDMADHATAAGARTERRTGRKREERTAGKPGRCVPRSKSGGVLLSQGIYSPSTIGAERLNFRVRDGNGCDPVAMATGNQLSMRVSPQGLQSKHELFKIQALGRLVPVG